MDIHEIAQRLKAPFPAEDIDWRVQRAMVTRNGNKAIVLAYITSRAVQERLDEVFGIGGWRDEYERWGEKGVKCGISCLIDGQWVTKWDGADDTNIEPTKGGISDAFKRAAVKWGIGRYLYNLPESWVDIKDSGTYYISTEVKNGSQKVQIKGYWDPPQLPDWALPEAERSQQKAPPPQQRQEATTSTNGSVGNGKNGAPPKREAAGSDSSTQNRGLNGAYFAVATKALNVDAETAKEYAKRFASGFMKREIASFNEIPQAVLREAIKHIESANPQLLYQEVQAIRVNSMTPDAVPGFEDEVKQEALV